MRLTSLALLRRQPTHAADTLGTAFGDDPTTLRGGRQCADLYRARIWFEERGAEQAG